MLQERNDNRRQPEAPSSKTTLLPKKSKKLLKENKESFNSPSAYANTPKLVKIPTVDDPLKQLVLTETNKVRSKCLKKILAYELEKSTGNFRSDFLKRHKITVETRTRMIDWMIEVMNSFSCGTNTFFMSIDIMDTYLHRTSRVLDSKAMHLLGVTCMLMASKMEEIIPFKVTTVVEKMTHGKLKHKEIVECETQILMTLNFKLLNEPSLFIIVELLLVKLGFHDNRLTEDINKVVTYITKMLMHDYALITKYPLKYLAASSIYICFKIMEQVNREFKTKSYVDKLKLMLELNEQMFYAISESLLTLAKNFERSFPTAKNLLKFDSFSLDKDDTLGN